MRSLPGRVLVLGLLFGGCQAVSGLSDYEVGEASATGSQGVGGAASSTSASGSTTQGPGGNGAGGGPGPATGSGGDGGGACVPQEEICGNDVDEDCDGLDCSETAWATVLSGAAFQMPTSIAVLPSGNVAVAGTYADGSMLIGGQALPAAAVDKSALFYALLEPDGTPIWAFGIADGAGTLPEVTAANGAVVLSGRFNGSATIGDYELSSEASDPFVARIGEDGTAEWAVALDGDGSAHVRDVEVRGSDVLVSGVFTTSIQIEPLLQLSASGGLDDVDGFLAILDGQTGEAFDALRVGYGEVTVQGVSGAGYLGGGDIGVVAPFTGGVNIAAPEAAGAGFAVAGLDDSLVAQWQRVVRTSNVLSSAIAVDDVVVGGNRIAVVGRVAGTWEVVEEGTTTALFQTADPDDIDLFVAVWSGDGDLLWSRQLGDEENQTWFLALVGVTLDADEGVILAAGFRGQVDPSGRSPLEAEESDWLLAAFDGGGDHRWSRRASAEGDGDGALATALDPATGQLLFAGTTIGDLDITDPPPETSGGDAIEVVVARLAN